MIVLAGLNSALNQSTNLEEIHGLRDRAETIRRYVESVAMGLDVQNRATEVKLRCERQIGQILLEFSTPGGDRKSKDRDPRMTLQDLGIAGSQFFRWQREASVPEEDFVR